MRPGMRLVPCHPIVPVLQREYDAPMVRDDFDREGRQEAIRISRTGLRTTPCAARIGWNGDPGFGALDGQRARSARSCAPKSFRPRLLWNTLLDGAYRISRAWGLPPEPATPYH